MSQNPHQTNNPIDKAKYPTPSWHISDSAITGRLFLACMLVAFCGYGIWQGWQTVEEAKHHNLSEEDVISYRLEKADPSQSEIIYFNESQTASIPNTYTELFQTVGGTYGIDWHVLAGIAYYESRFNPKAIGADGEFGLMQIHPDTWAEWATEDERSTPFDPYTNVVVSAKYLQFLQGYVAKQGKNDWQWILAAYNWGPQKVQRHLQANKPWLDVPSRTRGYSLNISRMAYDKNLPTPIQRAIEQEISKTAP